MSSLISRTLFIKNIRLLFCFNNLFIRTGCLYYTLRIWTSNLHKNFIKMKRKKIIWQNSTCSHVWFQQTDLYVFWLTISINTWGNSSIKFNSFIERYNWKDLVVTRSEKYLLLWCDLHIHKNRKKFFVINDLIKCIFLVLTFKTLSKNTPNIISSFTSYFKPYQHWFDQSSQVKVVF